MCGGTTFNSPLHENEHLMVEDDAPKDIQSRRTFGARLKQIAANERDMLHTKGKNAITLKPFRRLSVSVNDEASNLDILPVLEDSLLDKIVILKAHPGEMPMPTGTSEEKTAFAEKIKSELPAYLAYLLKMQIPAEIKGGRYGVEAFQDKEIVEAMQETAPEHQLDELILKAFPARVEPWDDTALQMYVDLMNSSVEAAARKILASPRTCGMYLSRLAAKNPRYKKRTVNGNQKYRIEFHVDGKSVHQQSSKTVIDFKTGQYVTGKPVCVKEETHVTVVDPKTGQHATGTPIIVRSFAKESVTG
jgi:hypothetical protein